MGVKIADALGAEVTVLSHSLRKQEDWKRLEAEKFWSVTVPRPRLNAVKLLAMKEGTTWGEQGCQRYRTKRTRLLSNNNNNNESSCEGKKRANLWRGCESNGIRQRYH